MNLQEQISIIKSMMGLYEQDEKKGAQVKPNLDKYFSSALYLKDLNKKVIKGSYSAEGKVGAYDALHSFHRRASDGFGGRINTHVKDEIKEYKKKYKVKAVDITKVSIKIDPNTLTVNWEVTIGPSIDGYTYEEFDSRGSAGGGEGAVNKQLNGMHEYHSGKPKLVYHYNETIPVCFNSNGKKLDKCKGTINMQQKFFKYGKKI
jgi:hypothetical protein